MLRHDDFNNPEVVLIGKDKVLLHTVYCLHGCSNARMQKWGAVP